MTVGNTDDMGNMSRTEKRNKKKYNKKKKEKKKVDQASTTANQKEDKIEEVGSNIFEGRMTIAIDILVPYTTQQTMSFHLMPSTRFKSRPSAA